MRSFGGWYWLRKVGGSEFCGFRVVDMDSPLDVSIFIDHLVLIRNQADAEGAFPAWG